MHERTVLMTAPLSEWQAFRAANPDIQFIDAFVIDINGNTAGKRLPAADGDKLFKDGVMYSACAPVADCRGWGHNAGGLGRDPMAIPTVSPGQSSPHCNECRGRLVPTAQIALPYGGRRTKRQGPVVRPAHDPRRCDCEVPRRGLASGHGLRARVLPDRSAPQRRWSASAWVRCRAVRAPRRAGNLSLDAVDDMGEFLNRVDAAAARSNCRCAGPSRNTASASTKSTCATSPIRCWPPTRPCCSSASSRVWRDRSAWTRRSWRNRSCRATGQRPARSREHRRRGGTQSLRRRRRRSPAAPRNRRHAGTDVRLDGPVRTELQLAAPVPRPVRADLAATGDATTAALRFAFRRARARRAASSTASPAPTRART